ncbi:MAG: hypothetical protein QOG91_679 [Candidatus Parcubacteria bacterium]|jgi:uncharacterized membrane protein YoaT (DUF817 family)|nr:hypothetical protein [Candidatus Parcubacteria bacterium]
MNTLSVLLTGVAVILIMSYGAGLIWGGTNKANKIVTWELKQLSKIGRWVLKLLLRTIADVCHWLHKKL